MRIDANPTFTSTVRLTVLGQAQPAEIEVTWKHKDRTELKEWASRQLRADDRGIVMVEVEAAYIAEAIEGWSGPVDAEEKPVEYSLAALTRLLGQHHRAGEELYVAYMRAYNESRVKN